MFAQLNLINYVVRWEKKKSVGPLNECNTIFKIYFERFTLENVKNGIWNARGLLARLTVCSSTQNELICKKN